MQVEQALASGPLQVLRRVPDASNTVLLAEVRTDDGALRCVYKPAAGERPLWDFPGATLAMREVLTARTATALGWGRLIPATAWRDEGPLGPGMCQAFVNSVAGPPVGLFTDETMPEGWLPVAEGRTDDGTVVVLAHESSEDLQRIAALDVLVNNADRKGGHLLRTAAGSIAAIDHGVTWHADPKLRTVLWGWAGQPVPAWLAAELAAGAPAFSELLDGLDPPQAGGLDAAEVAAARRRLAGLLQSGTFPLPGADWPALPWPPM